MAHGGNGQKITYDEIKKNFIIEEPYRTKGAYPSGRGATIIASDVEYRFPKADNQSREYVHRNSSFQEHAEGHLIQQIRIDIEELKERGEEVTEIDLRLFQNYSPCDDYKIGANGEMQGCASDIIEFKQKLKESGKIVHITIKFANFYGWIGNFGYGPHNMAGLRKLLDNGVKVKLLQGNKDWNKFFHHKLVGLNDDQKQELLDRAGSDKRKDREKEDMELWEEHVLQTPNVVGDLGKALKNLSVKDN